LARVVLIDPKLRRKKYCHRPFHFHIIN
jgi:hypothetical protein